MAWEKVRTSLPQVIHPTDLRALVDTYPDPFIVADSQGVIRFLNRQAASVFGSTPPELTGTPLQISPDDQSYKSASNPNEQYSIRWQSIMWEGNQCWSAFLVASSMVGAAPTPTPSPEDEGRKARLVEVEAECSRLRKQLEEQRSELEQRVSQTEVKAREGEEAALDGWGQAEKRASTAEGKVSELQSDLERLQLRLSLAQETEAMLKQELQAQPHGQPDNSEADQQLRDELLEQRQRIAHLESELEQARQNSVSPMHSDEVPEHYVQLGQMNLQLESALASQQEAHDRLAQAQEANEMLERQLQAAAHQIAETQAQSQELEQSLHKRLSEMVARDRETKRLAFEDPLTGLANINILNQFIAYTIDLVAKGEGAAILLVIDIDRLRTINLTAGHNIGDQILIAFGERLRSYARATDVLARRRADEYVFVVSLQNNEAEAKATVAQMAQALAQKITGGLEEPFQIDGSSIMMTCGIGLSMFGTPGETTESVLEQAYTALERAKEMGRNRYYFFGQDLAERARRRMVVTPRLKEALDRQEFALSYQPILELKTGKIVGLESLLRWHDPAVGVLEPKDFLAFAEESGLIVPIGDWAIQEACMMAAQHRDIFVSINISMRQILQSDFTRRFMKAVERARVRPEKIIVDISETITAFDPDRAAQVMKELAYWKIGLAIDDFGTASTALPRLNQEFLRKIKIDHTLIRQCSEDENAVRLVLGTVHLATCLKLQAHAEGVETAEQLAFLKKINCHLAQGRFICPPVNTAGVKDAVKKIHKI